MKKMTKIFIGSAVILCGIIFVITSFRKASVPPQAANSPDISKAPVRVYGVVEPAGREVFVSPPMTKRVMEIYVKEGDPVSPGQRLCSLENSVEESQVRLAEAKVASAQKSLELSMDEMNRAKKLYKTKVDSEYKYTQARLKKELQKERLTVARQELDVAKAQLGQTVLCSPINGRVYKFDIRLGETLAAGDNSQIMLGAPDLWVRLFVESFWKDRVEIGSVFKVSDSETREFIGTGKVVYRSPYMGRRDFQTEDMQERFDTKYQEVVLNLMPEKKSIPVGLSVVAELK
jgi:multidrug efflux pump subunit AcrA (membrane-fusion protein)